MPRIDTRSEAQRSSLRRDRFGFVFQFGQLVPISGVMLAVFVAGDVPRLPVTSIVVGTDGSTAALERSRTLLEAAYPAFWVAPGVPGDFEADFANTLRGWAQLANVIIIGSLVIGGCSLAVSVIGGLAERKRPFSLLAAQPFLKAQMGYTLIAPGMSFYLIVLAGLLACLGIIASTMPLLQRITGPETARSG